MVKVASVYKDMICDKPKDPGEEFDVQEYATAQDISEHRSREKAMPDQQIDKGNTSMTTYRKVIP